MPKFIIEVPHEAEESACIKAVRVFMKTGSHFLTKADWGCKDGEHKAWILVEVDSKEEAERIVPHVYRNLAKVVQLNTFSLDEVEELMDHHSG
jgi:hypothetical protein